MSKNKDKPFDFLSEKYAGCIRKRRYDSLRVAEADAALKGIRAYACKECKGAHLTHRPKFEK